MHSQWEQDDFQGGKFSLGEGGKRGGKKPIYIDIYLNIFIQNIKIYIS